MRILAIETSTMLGGVAIMDESEGLLAELRLNIKSTHSERLLTGINLLLQQAGMKIQDIDVLGVASGPGSFTGLRIGLSTIKGFSFATGKPIVSVPTLEAFAWNFSCSKHPICIMLDARKKEVYAAVFRWRKKGFDNVIDATAIDPVTLLRSLADEPVIFAGEGALLYRDTIIEMIGENAIFAPPHKAVPSPSNVAYLGLGKAKDREFSEPLNLVPSYFRKSEAEIKIRKDREEDTHTRYA
ncbi:MAG TPA: tRNA (adenosine(37)-N6)-threonylcarbamoyltransferase complex dimerization subunit type 1 TsaB [Nitrospiraceae bacterium]|jgi:tRNA threonylcarbamoyladenosine biosynthesis protein TsaB|nr:tRNA (adenosine(37)-N6)-threonylcarbamoyltransferase complex dimerization subunit type 1 TsaB [Nitrospiraceae bacterium]